MVASAQFDDVVFHDVVSVDFDFSAIAQRTNFICNNNRKLVGRALRANFLNDADANVNNNHAHKQHVFVLTSEKHANCKHQVNKVKKRADVRLENVGIGTRIRRVVDIRQPRLHPFIDFLCG